MKRYEMSQEQLDKIMDAGRPTPVMSMDGKSSMFGTPQANANAAWGRLGKEMGFQHMTVRPVSGESDRIFTAEPAN